MPASGPDVVCPDELSLREARYRLRAIVAHQRLQSGGLSAAGASTSWHNQSKFAHPVASVVVSGGGEGGSGGDRGGQQQLATLDQGHYVALVREVDSNACVLYSDSSSQFFAHEQDAMTSPLQGYLVIFEQM